MSSAKSRSPSDSVNVHMIPLLTPMSVLFIRSYIALFEMYCQKQNDVKRCPF